MSILKSILHHYNKATKSYDTLHPETESAQVTDWNQGIVNTLASTALGSLVNTLTSDSLLASMIKKVLIATGVKYNIAQNGYVCLGSFFGGLILQWGSFRTVASGSVISLPISATPVVAIPVDMNTTNNSLIYSTVDYRNGSFRVYGNRVDGNTELYGTWLAICF